MLACKCCDSLPYPDRVWHGLFRRWYDHDQAGHRIRARILSASVNWWASLIWP